MDHLVVRIVFLLACVCVDACVKYLWKKQKRVCAAEFKCAFGWIARVRMCEIVRAHTGCLLSGVRVTGRLLCRFNSPILSNTLEPVLSMSFMTETKGSSKGRWLI